MIQFHAIAYTKERGYFAKNLLRLAAPGLDGEDPSETMNYHYLFQKTSRGSGWKSPFAEDSGRGRLVGKKD